MSGGFVSLESVGFAYPGGGPVLDGVDAVFGSGSVGIIGRSGEGKSTLLAVLGMLLRPSEGRLLIDGRDPAGMGERERSRLRGALFGFAFQDHLLDESLTLEQNILLPSLVSGGRRLRAANRERARGLAQRLGVEGILDRRPGAVSGGQRQRASVLRALAHGPRLVVADEPTGALDPATALDVLDALLGACADGGGGLVMVTHDHELAGRCDRVLRLTQGRLAPLEGVEAGRVG